MENGFDEEFESADDESFEEPFFAEFL
jgi:hypothetical protein